MPRDLQKHEQQTTKEPKKTHHGLQKGKVSPGIFYECHDDDDDGDDGDDFVPGFWEKTVS